mmetsp:Transcript_30698/g.98929  ORF Transcript_30698/g.98929 Transcript_30698/m.98929 type:complete len:291 (-) Transcript_30698:266-1138(-)|eukprot:CAMPEP_0118917602 /NCGR_PEP_ID=MMETSP1166-20130328/17419_1 /TAXON_ID=1104430 /ORGANISM="Chrysoreinhardia sp, Strain CCMP3193" /LENGTH=290 /DNA_ID=CAMNT_0006857795 /DNA_START=99 /DNA_END=971 /DNA_ORIENTATION=-
MTECACFREGCCCCECVETSEVGVIERCGQYDRLASAGFHCLQWPCEAIAGRVSLRVQQLDVQCETKTLDNVFVSVVISVQYSILQESIYEAFYRLSNPRSQIQSYVYDTVRATIPMMKLDDAFEAKEEVAMSVKKSLGDVMSGYGYEIHQALVTDLSPDAKVKAAMNEINASKRLKDAAFAKAEGEKIVLVKAAEAAAEANYLSGVGVARQRKAIVDGLRESISQFSGNVRGTSAKDVIDLLLLTQYFDMLRDVGNQGGTSTFFLPTKKNLMRDGLLQANAGLKTFNYK